METRSRSARNATQSFPSKMIFRSRKMDDEKMRTAIEASSLFIPIGKLFTVSDSKAASSIIAAEKPKAVVLIPSEAVLSSPRSWASALSSAPYLVVIGDKSIRKYRTFMSFIDNVIFSPVPRALSAAFITSDRSEAEKLLSAVSDDESGVITISVNLER